MSLHSTTIVRLDAEDTPAVDECLALSSAIDVTGRKR
jgi:hypothetical protein